jgi:adenylylsulfate kinase
MKKNQNITPYLPAIDQAVRRLTKGHSSAVLWFTGLSGSGKSTIANSVEKKLVESYCAHTYLLDGDNIRNGINSDLGFSLSDRSENIRRVGEIAKLMADAGLIVLTAFISPLRVDRDQCRALIGTDTFLEIFIDCPLEDCTARDPKGLYAKAQAGEILEFTGVSSPYEAPTRPDLILKTNQQTIEACTLNVIEILTERGILTGKHKVNG